MPGKVPDKETRTRIGGIKLSSELIQLTVSLDSDSKEAFRALLNDLSREQVNIYYLNQISSGSPSTVTLCVNCSDRAALERIISSRMAAMTTWLEAGAGCLTLFPHGQSLGVLGSVNSLLAGSSVRVRGFCTSVSALTVLLDYKAFDRAVELIETRFELPENHAPLHYTPSVKQVPPSD